MATGSSSTMSLTSSRGAAAAAAAATAAAADDDDDATDDDDAADDAGAATRAGSTQLPSSSARITRMRDAMDAALGRGSKSWHDAPSLMSAALLSIVAKKTVAMVLAVSVVPV